jgi:hypothetical protein
MGLSDIAATLGAIFHAPVVGHGLAAVDLVPLGVDRKRAQPSY